MKGTGLNRETGSWDDGKSLKPSEGSSVYVMPALLQKSGPSRTRSPGQEAKSKDLLGREEARRLGKVMRGQLKVWGKEGACGASANYHAEEDRAAP